MNGIKRISLCSMAGLLLWGFTACTASAEEDKAHDMSIVSYELSEATQTAEEATSTNTVTTTAKTSTTVTTTTTAPAETTATTEMSTGATEPCVVYCDPYDEEDYIDFDAYNSIQREGTAVSAPAIHHSSGDYNRNGSYLFIGDSRTVGMSYFEPMEYFAEVSCGLSYFYDNYDAITAYRGYNIVFNLGVNDLYRLNDYINMYWNLPQEFVENNHIIVVSVNPTDGSYSHLNSDIDWYNSNLSISLPEGFEWIDTNSYLRSIGFSTSDGLHYQGNTYCDIYNAIVFGF